jgi:hypothetical protein
MIAMTMIRPMLSMPTSEDGPRRHTAPLRTLSLSGGRSTAGPSGGGHWQRRVAKLSVSATRLDVADATSEESLAQVEEGGPADVARLRQIHAL